MTAHQLGTVIYLNLGGWRVEEAPALVLAIDNSGSMMGDPIMAVRAAATELIRCSPDGAEIGLVTFGSSVQMLAPPTTTREFVVSRVQDLRGDEGATRMRDAIAEGAMSLGPQRRQPRFLIVMSDGADNGSQVSEKDATATLVEAGVIVVGIGTSEDACRSLEPFTRATDGLLVPVNQAARITEAFLKAGTFAADRTRAFHTRLEAQRLLDELARHPRDTFHLAVDVSPTIPSPIWTPGSNDTALEIPKPMGESLTTAIRAAVSARLAAAITWQQEPRPGQPDPDAAFYDLLVLGSVADTWWPTLADLVRQAVMDARSQLTLEQRGFWRVAYLPVLPDLRSQDRPVQALGASAEWWAAAAGHRTPRQVDIIFPIGRGNRHRTWNPHGIARISPEHQAAAQATVAAVLRAAPSLLEPIQKLVQAPVEEDAGLAAVLGAAGILLDSAKGTRCLAQKAAADLLTQCADAEHESPLAKELAEKRLQAGLDPASLEGELLAAPRQDDPVRRLLGTRFEWHRSYERAMRTPNGPEGFDALAHTLEREASEFGVTLREGLGRLLNLRGDQLWQRQEDAISHEVGRCLFAEAPQGSVMSAEGYLERLTTQLLEWRQEVERTQLSHYDFRNTVTVFGHPSIPLKKAAAPDPITALRILTVRLRERPERVAYFLRSVLLMAAVAAAIAGAPAAGVTLPYGPSVWQLAGVLAVGAWCVLRWRHLHERIQRAAQHYADSVTAALRHDLAVTFQRYLLGWYRRAASRIGEQAGLPSWWDQDPEKDEGRLAMRERLSALPDILRDLAARFRQAQQNVAAQENPFIIEVGDVAALTPPFNAQWGFVEQELQDRWSELVRQRTAATAVEWEATHVVRLGFERQLIANGTTAAGAVIQEWDWMEPLRASGSDMELLQAIRGAAAPLVRLPEKGEEGPRCRMDQYTMLPDQIRGQLSERRPEFLDGNPGRLIRLDSPGWIGIARVLVTEPDAIGEIEDLYSHLPPEHPRPSGPRGGSGGMRSDPAARNADSDSSEGAGDGSLFFE